MLDIAIFLKINTAQTDCGSTCAGCFGSPTNCNSDTINRCVYSLSELTCTATGCGACGLCDGDQTACNADSQFCHYSLDSDKCAQA